jgi:hypothetical protein
VADGIIATVRSLEIFLEKDIVMWLGQLSSITVQIRLTDIE